MTHLELYNYVIEVGMVNEGELCQLYGTLEHAIVISREKAVVVLTTTGIKTVWSRSKVITFEHMGIWTE